MRRVYVTGMGFVSSIGNNATEVLHSLKSLKTGIEPHPELLRIGAPITLAGTIKNFNLSSIDPEDWELPATYRPSRALLRTLSPHSLYAHYALEQAFERAAWGADKISNEMTGLHTASIGSVTHLRHHLDRMHNLGVERMSPKSIVSSIPGTLNFAFVSHYKIRGNSCGFVSACASSGHALGSALDEIRLGRQDRMIVVGAEDGDINTILPFSSMRALSPETDPKRGAKPFDVNRSGFIGTGGATALLLEAEDVVDSSSDPIAEFVSWGQASDGFNAVLPEPNGEGLGRAMQNALRNGALDPSQIDYINAHATATIPGDIAELRALKRVFGTETELAISSTKALTGHGLSLSSILEAGLSLVSLENGICPGTAHLETPDPEGAGLNLLTQTETTKPSIALSNSSGFGGTNVSLIFKRV